MPPVFQRVRPETDTEYSINDLVHVINEILGTSLTPIYRPKREGDLMRSLASTELAGEVLRFTPRESFREGLERTVGWFRDVSA